MRSIASFIAICSLLVGVSDLAAQTKQTTIGTCSPTISGNNNQITFSGDCGVDPRAIKNLNDLIAIKDLTITEKIKEAEEWADRYHKLEQQLHELQQQQMNQVQPSAGESEVSLAGLITYAQNLLHEGRLEEAGALAQRITNIEFSDLQQEGRRGPSMAESLDFAGDTHFQQARFVEALREYERAAAIWRDLAATNPVYQTRLDRTISKLDHARRLAFPADQNK